MKLILTLLLSISLLASNAQSHHRYKYYDTDNRGRGIVLMVGGLAFTVAGAIETNKMYMIPVNSNPSNPVWKPLPFWQQTPRQIMVVVGVSLSISGLIVALHKN